jgi:GNAT superfamily N-acetyltransferase
MSEQTDRLDISDIGIVSVAPEALSTVVPFMAQANADTYSERLGLPETAFATPQYLAKLDGYIGHQLICYDAELYLLEFDDQISGTVGLTIEPNLQLARLWGNRIAPEAQGLGLGTLLFQYALGHARQQGVKEIAADVNNISPAAKKFYESQGMTVFARDRYQSPILPDQAPEQSYSEMRGQVADLTRHIDQPHAHLRLV